MQHCQRKFKPARICVFGQFNNRFVGFFFHIVSLAWNTKPLLMPQIVKNHKEIEQVDTAKELGQAKQALQAALLPFNAAQICNSGNAVNVTVTQNAQPLNKRHEGTAVLRGTRAEQNRLERRAAEFTGRPKSRTERPCSL